MTIDPSSNHGPPGQRHRDRLALLAILLLGAALRFAGLGFGLPLEMRPDEGLFWREVVVGMAETGSADPGIYVYPQLPYYGLYGAFAGVHALAGVVGHPAGELSLVAFCRDVTIATWIQRSLAALGDVLTILVVYALGCRLRSRELGLAAAALYGVCHLAVRQAHFGVIDAPANLFCALALLAILRAAARGGATAFALAGAACGLATAMRYLPGILVIPLVAVALLAPARGGGRIRASLRLQRVLISIAAMALAFLAGSPFTILSWDAFRSEWLQQIGASLGAESFGLAALWPQLRQHLEISLRYGMGIPLLALTAIGMVINGVRPRLATCALLLFTISWLGILALGETGFVRYALPLAPVLVLFAADAALTLGRRAPSALRPAATLTLILLASALPLGRALRSDLIFLEPSTLEVLDRWLDTAMRDGRITFTSPEIAAKMGRAPGDLAPYDPKTIACGAAPTFLVVATHPLRFVTPPRGVETLLAAAATSEPVFALAPGAPGALEGAIFDARDAFFYAFAGLDRLRRGGPALRVYRIIPGPAPETLPPPPPPPAIVRAGAFRRQLGVQWLPGDGAQTLAFHVRYATEEQLAAGIMPPPLALPGGSRLHVFDELPPGRYFASVSAVNLGGESPQTVDGPVEIAPP